MSVDRTEKFILEGKSRHGAQYSYGLTEYLGSNEIVIVSCVEHGEFSIRARNFLRARTPCIKCRKVKQSAVYWGSVEQVTEIEQTLYVLCISVKKEVFVKVGVTSNFEDRVKDFPRGCKVKEVFTKSMKVEDAVKLEQEIIRKFKKHRYYPKIEFGGRTECFKVKSLGKIKSMLKKRFKKKSGFLY